jgi:ACS family hexuronate transporter-like MFS transporter
LGVILAPAFIDPILWLFVLDSNYLNEVYGMDVKSIGLYGWHLMLELCLEHGLRTTFKTVKKGWISIHPAYGHYFRMFNHVRVLLAMLNPGGPTGGNYNGVILFGFQTVIENAQTLPSDLFQENNWNVSGFSGMAAVNCSGLTYLVPWLTRG